MITSVGLSAVGVYAVPILIGGALLVSACPTRQPHRERGPAQTDGQALHSR